ncbi:hypothetical protein CYMTET_44228 [Cymbomonas tetramitiformis]|uniref:Uncharacterized protein n=1 Tax=Cymbomonas tetramitiformis TaxID=36881 RepID=A0AAE0C0K7_9CHLO|nr:hypothetical protein CYMTET_44228 [Cymbomonas tetramitiformis]
MLAWRQEDTVMEERRSRTLASGASEAVPVPAIETEAPGTASVLCPTEPGGENDAATENAAVLEAGAALAEGISQPHIWEAGGESKVASAEVGAEGKAARPTPARWPFTEHLVVDVAQAWALLEMVAPMAEPGQEQGGDESQEALHAEMEVLLGRMGVPEKRVWLGRHLYRYHRDETLEKEEWTWEPPLAFLECDRAEDQLFQLRQQLFAGTGLGSTSLTGECPPSTEQHLPHR